MRKEMKSRAPQKKQKRVSMKDIAEALTRMDNFLTNLKKKQAREQG